MKMFAALLIFAVLGATFASPITDGGSNEDWSIEDLHQVKREVLSRAERLIEEALVTMGEEYCREANIDTKEPLKEVVERAKAIDTESETVCALIQNHIEHVFEPLTTVIDQCGKSARLGTVATSSIHTVKSVVGYLCSITGEQILEFVNPCLEDIDLGNAQCAQEFEHKFETLSPENTSGTFVEEMCKILPSGESCVVGEITAKCELPITRNTWTGLFNAALKSCK